MTISAQVVVLLLVVFISSPVFTKVNKKNAKCSPFPYAFLKHGQIKNVGTQKYRFSCKPGYLLTSPLYVRCWKGKWSSDKQPECVRVGGYCDDPPSIPGARILGDERRVGSTVMYMCNPGFLLMGEGKRTCLQSGHWSGITPSCMDESEPLQKVAERLKTKFVEEVASYSSDSIVSGRSLDHDSIKHGLELVILIDRSSSIDPKDFKTGINFVKYLLETFGVRNGNNTSGTRAAVLTFGNDVEILFNLDNATINGPLAANRAMDTIKAGGGGTAMEDAFMSVFTRLSPLRAESKRALFMITDGEPNTGTLENTIFFATQLKNSEDFEIFTVGVGRGINYRFLSELASEPATNHIFILDSYSDLMSIMETIKGGPKQVQVINPDRCGYIKHPEHFLKRWPWLAAIYIGFANKLNETQLSFCTGTLICKQWVITAASCFYQSYENKSETVVRNSTKEVFVVMGERSLMEDDRKQVNFYATDVRIHPEFNPLQDLQNNLALVKLNAPVPKATFRPACLPPTDRPVLMHLDLNTNVSIAGWGLRPSKSNEPGINAGTVRNHVTNITAVIEEESSCGAPKENIFCAGSGIHTCDSDLGSPIIAVDSTTELHHLIGVQSRRTNCHRGINHYAELTKYIRWINTETNECQLQHYMVK